jgi:hypothetical protein
LSIILYSEKMLDNGVTAKLVHCLVSSHNTKDVLEILMLDAP